MKRQIIHIDQDKCDGCGLCVPNCQEGALQIIDGKARLISDLFCDGLGACIGHCPQGAIEMIEREAEPYDERRVMDHILPQGMNTVMAHLRHLDDHGAEQFLQEALAYLHEKGIDIEVHEEELTPANVSCNCPGSAHQHFDQAIKTIISGSAISPAPSTLRQWPVQMHLLNPSAPFLKGADLLLAADCTSFAMGAFHSSLLDGKALAIACPKLDSNKEMYVEKLRRMIDEAHINTMEVAIMEVPCCGGLIYLAQTALAQAARKIPVKKTVVSIRGEILESEWI
jgi:ferredoxin